MQSCGAFVFVKKGKPEQNRWGTTIKAQIRQNSLCRSCRAELLGKSPSWAHRHVKKESLAPQSRDGTFGEHQTTETFSQVASAQRVVAARQMDGKTVFVVPEGQTTHTSGILPPLFLTQAF